VRPSASPATSAERRGKHERDRQERLWGDGQQGGRETDGADIGDRPRLGIPVGDDDFCRDGPRTEASTALWRCRTRRSQGRWVPSSVHRHRPRSAMRLFPSKRRWGLVNAGVGAPRLLAVDQRSAAQDGEASVGEWSRRDRLPTVLTLPVGTLTVARVAPLDSDREMIRFSHVVTARRLCALHLCRRRPSRTASSFLSCRADPDVRPDGRAGRLSPESPRVQFAYRCRCCLWPYPRWRQPQAGEVR
jgi:hypothetical protein